MNTNNQLKFSIEQKLVNNLHQYLFLSIKNIYFCNRVIDILAHLHYVHRMTFVALVRVKFDEIKGVCVEKSKTCFLIDF